MSNTINGTSGNNQFPDPTSSGISGQQSAVSSGDSKSWFEAMAKAWGSALDQQAGKITSLSDQLSNGGADQPSVTAQLSAEAQRMAFLSTSASSANNAVGQALDTLGRKQ